MWEIKKHTVSGSQGAHIYRTAPSKDQAILCVLTELPWQKDTNGWPFVLQDGEPCYEDQATCDLEEGHFAYSRGESTITYRLTKL